VRLGLNGDGEVLVLKVAPLSPLILHLALKLSHSKLSEDEPDEDDGPSIDEFMTVTFNLGRFRVDAEPPVAVLLHSDFIIKSLYNSTDVMLSKS
jgi:hypothetical protein